MYEVVSITGPIGSFRANEVSGKKVVNVSIAVNNGKESTQWWDVALWGEQAETFEKLEVEKGAIIQATLRGITAHAYMKDDKPQAALKAQGTYFRILSSKK